MGLRVSTSLSNCVSDFKHNHGCSKIPGAAASEAASGHYLHRTWFEGISDGVRGQQRSDETHHGGIQLLHGLSCAADC